MRPQPRTGVVVIPVGALRRLMVWLIAIAIVVVIGAVLWQQKDRFAGASAPPIDKNSYQAVVLVTNQLYFGKLQIDGDNYLLTDVFYLSQPADPSAKSQLVKRGNELWGPKEPMTIPSRSVLFLENMRDDSDVVVAIRAFKAGGGANVPAATPAPTSPTATATPAAASPSATARPSATR